MQCFMHHKYTFFIRTVKKSLFLESTKNNFRKNGNINASTKQKHMPLGDVCKFWVL